MPSSLQWIADTYPTALHALHLRQSAHALADQRWGDQVDWIDALARQFTLSSRAWSELIVGAAERPWSTIAVAFAARQTALSPPQLAARLADACQAIDAHLRDNGVDIAGELRLRAAPLREHWEARGNGFLWRLARAVPQTAKFFDAHPTIPLVGLLPLRGGDAYVATTHAALACEWLLTHADQRLPETVRLAWLVTQLALQATAAATDASFTDDARRDVHQVTSVLLTLAICDDLEWFAGDAPRLELALAQWRLVPAERAATCAATLHNATRSLTLGSPVTQWWQAVSDACDRW